MVTRESVSTLSRFQVRELVCTYRPARDGEGRIVRASSLVHSHPSGDPTPSPDDLLLTARICEAGEVLGFVLLDHLIVAAPHRYYSYRDAGLLGATPAGRARVSGPSGRPPSPVLPSRATTPCADPT